MVPPPHEMLEGHARQVVALSHDRVFGHYAVALQDAKQWLRNYKDDRGVAVFGHPYYWSAFVLIGESK